MTDLSKSFGHYPVGLKLIIGFMFLNSFLALVASRNVFGAGINLILAVGLLKLKNWAREWLIFLIVLGLIVVLLKTLIEMSENRLHNSDWLTLLMCAPLVVQVLSYLTSSKVKALFAVQPSSESSGIA
jgi:hypothetical protein